MTHQCYHQEKSARRSLRYVSYIHPAISHLLANLLDEV